MRLAFTKMHGLGNDFIVFDAAEPAQLPPLAALRRLADRRTGIGFDQALVLAPPRREGTDVFYRIFNADGSEVEQCGNGARCIARLVASRSGARGRTLVLDSPGGLVDARLRADGLVSVAMGVPDFDPRSLPFEVDAEAPSYRIELPSGPVEFGAVSIGNPHAVIRVRSVNEAPVDTVGPPWRITRVFHVGSTWDSWKSCRPITCACACSSAARARRRPAALAPAPRSRSAAVTDRSPRSPGGPARRSAHRAVARTRRADLAHRPGGNGLRGPRGHS